MTIRSKAPIARLADRSYRQVGRRWPLHYLAAWVSAGVAAGAIGVTTLALYFTMSAGEYVRILVAAELLIWVPETLIVLAIISRRKALISWMRGAREQIEPIAAWRAGASLPREILRQPILYAWVAVTAFAFDAYAAAELDLPVLSGGLVIFLGSIVLYAYWAVLRVWVLEAALRPVLVEISDALPEHTPLDISRIPLRWRLRVALPVMNLGTGTVLAGVFAEGNGLSDFALGIGVAAAVTMTISIWLIAFISDSVAVSMGELSDAARRIGEGKFATRVPVASTDETGELARSFNEMAAGLAERERIREAFGTYVDPAVAEHILREGTSLAGEEVEVTLLFLDIRGFTTFAERRSAPEVVATLNRLFERIVPVVHQHGGHIDKYIGDGLLAVFGAPRRHQDHADQALSAALEIAAAVDDEFGDALSVGVGLNSGRVVAGNVGGAGRLEFSVIGDAVNVAARVESATRQTGDPVLIAGRTKDLLRRTDRIEFIERPGLTLKGKTKAVEVYACRSRSEGRS